VHALANRLDDHAGGGGYVAPLGPGFIDQLALGDLWT
jgi:hypothetical protein